MFHGVIQNIKVAQFFETLCSHTCTESSLPGKPTYVRTRTFSDSVMVTWLAPEDGDLVRGYMVGYGEGVPDVNWRYVDANSNNVTIRNLSTVRLSLID